MKSWCIIARAQAQAPTDAQVGHGVSQIGGTVAPTQAGVGCLLRVQGVGSGGGKCRLVRSGREPPCSWQVGEQAHWQAGQETERC